METLTVTPEDATTGFSDGEIIQIGNHRFALQAWDANDQKSPDETVYAGYTRAEWESDADADAVVVCDANGKWSWTTADYNPQFHDEGGLRVVGDWHSGKAKHIGRAHDLWGGY